MPASDRPEIAPKRGERLRASTRPIARVDPRALLGGGLATLVVLGAIALGLSAVADELPPPAEEVGGALDLVLIGGLAFLAAYNGLSYIPTRQVSYLLYALLGAALTIVYLTYFDIGSDLLGLGSRLALRTDVNHAASGAALALALAFALAFLRVHRRRRRLASAAWGVVIALTGFSFAVLPWLDPRVSEVVNAVPGLLFPPIVIGLGVLAWRSGFLAARYYLAAWVPLLVVVLLMAVEVMVGRDLGVSGRTLGVANLLEMLLLALALTDRIKLAIEARELAHTEQVRALEDELEEVRRLGPYTLGEKLGEGGMGVVYEASHALLRRPTAVKLIHPHTAGDEEIQRFEREVRTTSRLTHPNTVTVYDYGRTEEGILYYAMELLDGATLQDVVEVSGPQPPARVARILHMVAGALGEAHAVGLIHRDIKPGNVILTEQGGELDVAKVVDFGLVKDLGPDAVNPELSSGTVLAGTPMYMAPEQLEDPPRLVPRSDLYALGAVAYYLLAGEQLFRGTVFQVMLRHMRDVPEPPSARLGAPLPEDLEALVESLLAKDVEERPRDAAEVQRRVEACVCFGDWTQDDARRWWDEFGEVLAARREEQRQRSGRRTRSGDVRPPGEGEPGRGARA